MMKKTILIGVITVFSFLTSNAQDKKHVILISIDGLRPDFYKDQAFSTPNLRKLMAQGVYADGVNSVFPSVTYPSHTTIVTGAYPARHGIFYNVPFESKNGRWYWDESAIKTPTLWDAAKKANLKTAALMWPVSVGAPIDYNFPVRRADNDDKTDQLTVTRPFVTPANLVDDMEASFGKLKQADFSGNGSIDVTMGKMANYIIATYKPDLTAIHFVSADHLQHEHGRDAAIVKEDVARIDSVIGTVIAQVEKSGMINSTVFIITGDHGMVDTEYSMAPNIWLAKQGLITEKDWKAKFHPAGGSMFLYLKDKNDQATLQKVKDILAAAPEAEKNLFRVIDRKELDAAGANPEVALALAFKKGVVGSAAIEGAVLKKAKDVKGNHGYYPDFQEIRTGFIASGPGISKGVVIPQMGIKDVSPIIAKLLNLDFTAPDGVLIPEILNTK